jgi:Flp pilus assembly protein TadD
MMEYRDTTKNVRQIGEELGVATILEGAVQRAGQRVRINAQLIDTKTDAHLWADTFDRELTPENIFDLQSDIAVAIAGALGRTLNPDSAAAQRTAAPTLDAEAFDLYLRARSTRSNPAESLIRDRIELYRRALERDPEFALAMGELGREYVNMFWYHTRRDADRNEGGGWIDQALELAPDEPQLRLWRAEYFYRAHLDYEAALQELDRAAEGLPGSAEAAALRGYIERRAGRPRESIAALERAAMLDPRSSEVLQSLMETSWLLGDLDTATRWKEQLVALPEAPHATLLLHPQALFSVLGDSGPLMARYADRSAAALASTPQYGFAFHYAYMARDFDLAQALIDALSEDVVEDQFSLVPKALMRAQLALAQGREEEARREAAAAVGLLDAVLKDHPDDYRAHMAQARAKAILGEAAAARDAASRALAMRIPSRDQMIRAELRAGQLGVLAMIDDSETLARAMDDYLQLEMKYWHFDGLVLDPVFDAHRDHPAFRALAAKYSRREPAS